MCKNILVVDNCPLRLSTIAVMYEGVGCEVFIAPDTDGALSVITLSQVDVVVTYESFCVEHGIELRAAIKEVRPELCIAVMGGSGGRAFDELPMADVYLRPNHFFTDLCRCTPSPHL